MYKIIRNSELTRCCVVMIHLSGDTLVPFTHKNCSRKLRNQFSWMINCFEKSHQYLKIQRFFFKVAQK